MMLEITDLTVRYGAVEALRNVSIKVAAGQFVAILGANGAGKSSLLRAISGIAPTQGGTIRFEGRDVAGAKAERLVQAGIAHVPEGRGIFPDLSVRNNLLMGAYSRRRSKELETDYGRVVDTFPILRERAAQPGYSLSGGEQQMLAIGRALMSGPKLLLADEVSLGLAPVIVKQVFAELDAVRRRGLGLLVVEQNARLALRYADYVYVLKNGRTVMEGSRDEVQSSGDLVDAYLGA
jgi:branched-chain amino acid transport system ATP-binding protein